MHVLAEAGLLLSAGARALQALCSVLQTSARLDDGCGPYQERCESALRSAEQKR